MCYYLHQEAIEPRSPFAQDAETVRPTVEYMFFHLHTGFTGGVGILPKQCGRGRCYNQRHGSGRNGWHAPGPDCLLPSYRDGRGCERFGRTVGFRMGIVDCRLSRCSPANAKGCDSFRITGDTSAGYGRSRSEVSRNSRFHRYCVFPFVLFRIVASCCYICDKKQTD